MSKAENLMNVWEFAEVLGVTPSCIRRWILERRITTVKVGRLVRIPQSEVKGVIDTGLRPALPSTRLSGEKSQVPGTEVDRIAKEGLGPIVRRSR